MDSLKPSDPRAIGGIELHGRLGEGGMGAVYFGVAPGGQQVAVKAIKREYADREDLRERFDREITAMGMVQGPRVASLVAAAEPGAAEPWLAMEYVRGLTLKEYVAGHGPLGAHMGAALGELLVEGLGAVHQAGLWHRDFKPDNIMLGPDGPKVIDFGLVTLTESDHDLTKTTDVIGTPRVMAPEHVRSAKELTAAADVYSFGATMLFATAHHYPYEQAGIHALLFAITDRDTAPNLSGLPPELAPAITAMLAYEPDARPTLEALSEQFRQVCAGAGLSPRNARVQFASLTYVEQPSDPPADLDPPTPPARSRHEARPAPPAIQALADRLRSGYERGARL